MKRIAWIVFTYVFLAQNFGVVPLGSIARATESSDNEPTDSSGLYKDIPSPVRDPIDDGSSITATTSHSEISDDDGHGNNNGEKRSTTHAEDVTVQTPNRTDEQTQKFVEEYSPKNIRNKLRRQYLSFLMENSKNQMAQMRSFQASADWQSTIWGHQTTRFPMETIMFFYSIGLINMGMMTYDYSHNPLIQEQHLQTLVDPIGHVSFYAFMIANGYAQDFLQKSKLFQVVDANMFRTLLNDPRNGTALGMKMLQTFKNPSDYNWHLLEKDIELASDKKLSLNPYTNSIAKSAYRSLVPYLSMTAGSMASHFTGDFLRTMQTCVKSIYKPYKIPAKQNAAGAENPAAALMAAQASGNEQAAPKDRLNRLSQDPCDVAWREWVMEKKFNQYAPALMSMILSTAGSGILTTAAKNVAKSSPFQSVKQAMSKGGTAIVKTVFRGADIGATVLGRMVTGWWGGAIALVGHFSQITVFTALDTIIHSWVEDKVMNYSMGNYYLWPRIDAFPKKAETLSLLLEKEIKEKFRNDTKSCEDDIQSVGCSRNDIEGWMYNFSESMMKWREFNQTKALQAHSQWVDKINKFQKMEQFAKRYYEEFLLDMKKTNVCTKNQGMCTKVKNNDFDQADFDKMMSDTSTASLADYNELNKRTYPLFGVDPVMNRAKGQEFNEWMNLYKDGPKLLEGYQTLRVQQVAKEMSDYFKRHDVQTGYYKNYQTIIENILTDLQTNDVQKMGVAIQKMRSLANARNNQVPEPLQAVFFRFLESLGNPSPLLFPGEGFGYAFENYSENRELAKDVPIPEFYRNVGLSTQFRFSKKSDYVYYHMLCGPQIEKNEPVVNSQLGNFFGVGLGGFRDLFIPPRLTDGSVKLDICSGVLKFQDSYKMYQSKITEEASGKSYAGAYQALEANLSASIKEIINNPSFDPVPKEDKERLAELNKPLRFLSQWWEKYVEKQVVAQLEKFKVDYEPIAVNFLESQYKGVGTIFGVALHSEVVKNSVVYSSMQEGRIFSLIANTTIKANLDKNEYSQFLIDPQTINLSQKQKLSDFTPAKIRQPTDLIAFQVAPWYEDYNTINGQAKPELFKFQVSYENLLGRIHQKLSAAKVVESTAKDGQKRSIVNLSMDKKQREEFYKDVDDRIQAIEKEMTTIQQTVEKKLGAKPGKEVLKPVRILEFSKTKMAQLAQELKATVETIRFAADQAESYSNKNKSKEELTQEAERLKREESKRKCIENKGMGTLSGGGGC